MQNFNFQRFKSLVKYDLAENGRSYVQAMGISFLVYFFLVGLCYYLDSLTVTDDYDLVSRHWHFQVFINSSLYATAILIPLAIIFATGRLVVNRYCEARTATMFNMLPATHREKGSLVMLQLFMLAVAFPIIFYVVTYCLTYLAMIALGHSEYVRFFLLTNFTEFFTFIWHAEVSSFLTWMVRFTTTLFLAFIPVSMAIGMMVYENTVTFFRERHVQLKAIFINYLFYNAIGLLLVFAVYCLSVMGRAGYFYGLEDWFNAHPLMAYLPFDILIVAQLPVLAALVWWFFKRLHYKEIR